MRTGNFGSGSGQSNCNQRLLRIVAGDGKGALINLHRQGGEGNGENFLGTGCDGHVVQWRRSESFSFSNRGDN